MILVYFILLVGVLVFVHELGHFLVAKGFDVKVLKFSLGFGPSAFKFRRGETEYCIAILPLGGFVKMLGENPNDEITPEDSGRAFHQKPLWQRTLVVLAGPVFNLVFPVLIFLLFFATQTSTRSTVIGRVIEGLPAASAGVQAGDRIVAIDGKPVRYWKELQRLTQDRADETIALTLERDGKQITKSITLYGHVETNFIGVRQKTGLLGIDAVFEGAQIGIADPHSPAAKGGLATGDVLTSINGTVVEHWIDVPRTLDRIPANTSTITVSYLRVQPSLSRLLDIHLLEPQTTTMTKEVEPTTEPTTVPATQPIAGTTSGNRWGIESGALYVQTVEAGSVAETIGIKRGDRVLAFDGKPIPHWGNMSLAFRSNPDARRSIRWKPFLGDAKEASFTLKQEKFIDEYKNERVIHVFGAYNREMGRESDPIPIEGRAAYTISESLRRTGKIISGMTLAIVQMFRGTVPMDSIGGPLMLAQTAKVAAEVGWDRFLEIMALISINLGLLNLLPVPVLDGGHLMFFTIEAIKRGPVSLRAREIASYVGLFLLLSLMIFAFKNDIVRYWFR